jgi:hypothetical protein
MKTTTLLLTGLLATVLVACGGGKKADEPPTSTTPASNPPPPPAAPVRGGDLSIAQLGGEWFGTLEAVPTGGGDRVMQRLRVTMSGSNITIDDLEGVPSNLSGTLTKQGTQTFLFSVNNPDGTRPSKGLLFVDSSANYLLFVNEFFDVGVVRKGAPVLPPFANDALNGTWAGVTLHMDLNTTTHEFNNISIDDSNATCSGLTCPGKRSGTVNRTATYSADSVTATFGRWIGNYTDTPTASGQTRAFLSPDQVFSVVWACATGGAFPSGCDFSAWRRQ